MKIGTLVNIVARDLDSVGTGIFLGMGIKPPVYQSLHHMFLRKGMVEYYDSQFWTFEVINEISS